MTIFLILYTFVFFLFPWVISVYMLIKMIAKLYSIRNGIDIFEKSDIQKIRNVNPDFNKTYLNVIQCFLITLISWVVGFLVLFLLSSVL